MAQGPEGEAKVSPQTLQKLFFPVSHSVLGAFYPSYPDLFVYITELKTK